MFKGAFEMSSEKKTMKTAVFGGFKKSDVLAYIESLQNDAAEISGELDKKRAEALELRKKIDAFEEKTDELSKISKAVEEKDAHIAELENKIKTVSAESEQYKSRLLEYQDKSERLSRAEKQIGAAYIDARRYSDEIVDNAKAKAKDIGAIASQDVKSQANDIEQLLRDVDAVSKKFNSSLEQLHKDVYALSKKLNSSASNLLNLHTELPGLEAPAIFTEQNPVSEDILKDMPDAISVEETDDGSGLTYISYEPNTEFNEDLNIQPSDITYEDNNG